MRIIRHLTPAGPAYAALQPDGSAREIAGDIFGEFRVTDRVVTPGKLLAPVVPSNLLAIGLNYKKTRRGGRPGRAGKARAFPQGHQLRAESRRSDRDSAGTSPARRWITNASSPSSSAGAARTCTRATARSTTCSATPAPTTCRARDWQRKPWGGGQWCQAKSFDTFCPLGPVLVTRDEIPESRTTSASARCSTARRCRTGTRTT